MSFLLQVLHLHGLLPASVGGAASATILCGRVNPSRFSVSRRWAWDSLLLKCGVSSELLLLCGERWMEGNYTRDPSRRIFWSWVGL